MGNLDERRYSVLIKQKRIWNLLLQHQIDVKLLDVCHQVGTDHQWMRYSHIIYLGIADEFFGKKNLSDGCFIHILEELRKTNKSLRPILITTSVSNQDCMNIVDCFPENFNSQLLQLAESYRDLYNIITIIVSYPSNVVAIGGFPRPDQNNLFSRYVANIGDNFRNSSEYNINFNATSMEHIIEHMISVVYRSQYNKGNI